MRFVRRPVLALYTLTGFLHGVATATPTPVPTVESTPRGIIILPTITFPTATRTPTPVNFGNFVWDDLDQDGQQDAGEPGLAGVTVQLWNDAKTDLIDTDVTDANGIYTVTSPGPGAYRVRVILQSASDQFSPKDQAGGDNNDDSDINPTGTSFGFTDIINVASNVISITSIDAGIIKFRTPTPTRTPTPVNFGNFVWDDLDQDGQQDAGEPGLAGVTVQLWNDAKTDLIDTDVTDASGIYTVRSPGPGMYRVRVVLPSVSDQFSPKDQAGGDNNDDSDFNPTGTSFGFTDIISVAANVISIANIDAGIIKFRTATPTRTPTPINVGNFVWNDLDEDGVQDPGEPGLVGITVQLWSGDRTNLIDDTVTNSNGNYTLVAPTPGEYRVRVIRPQGSAFTIENAAAATDNTDSDINASIINLNFTYTDIYVFASNLISITSIDAGLINVPPTPTPTRTSTPTRTPTRTSTPTRTPTPTATPILAPLDIDGDGATDPLTDGVLAMRYLFGFTGNTLISGALSPACTRCSSTAVEGYLDGLGDTLDVDDNNLVEALTDGLLIVRFLFGFTGTTLTNNAVAPDCGRCSSALIIEYLEGLV